MLAMLVDSVVVDVCFRDDEARGVGRVEDDALEPRGRSAGRMSARLCYRLSPAIVSCLPIYEASWR